MRWRRIILLVVSALVLAGVGFFIPEWEMIKYEDSAKKYRFEKTRHQNQLICHVCKKITSSCSEKLQEWFFEERKSNWKLHAMGGRRGQKEQEEHLKAGRSKASFGKSPHNYAPSRALDVMFLSDSRELLWDLGPFRALAGRLPEGIQWGGLWKSFPDNPHFEEIAWTNLVADFPNGNP